MQKQCYEMINSFQQRAIEQTAKTAFADALKALPFSEMLDEEGQVDPYKQDQFCYECNLRSYYVEPERLPMVYQGNPLLKVETESYLATLTDADRLRRTQAGLSKREQIKIFVEQLDQLSKLLQTPMILKEIQELKDWNPNLYAAYEKLGKERIETLGYWEKAINEAVAQYDYQRNTDWTALYRLINNSFHVGEIYTVKSIKEELIRIYKVLGIERPKGESITGQSIKEFFEVQPVNGGTRGFKLLQAKFK